VEAAQGIALLSGCVFTASPPARRESECEGERENARAAKNGRNAREGTARAGCNASAPARRRCLWPIRFPEPVQEELTAPFSARRDNPGQSVIH